MQGQAEPGAQHGSGQFLDRHWLVDQLRDEEAENQQTTRADIDSLRAQLDRIERRLEALGAGTPTQRGKPGRRKG